MYQISVSVIASQREAGLLEVLIGEITASAKIQQYFSRRLSMQIRIILTIDNYHHLGLASIQYVPHSIRLEFKAITAHRLLNAVKVFLW
jgi:hypothetical protein